MTEDAFDLTGRTALITGGSSGIGRAIAQLFAQHGANLVIGHTGKGETAKELARDLTSETSSVWTRRCDVRSEVDVDALAEWTTTNVGPIDIVINSAGVGGGDRPFEDITPSEWDRVIDVNLRGSYLIARAYFQAMKQAGGGRIINISSQLAYKGSAGLAHYCASKAGVIGFTRALALEGAPHNVLVNAIAPGPVDTPLLRNHSPEWLQKKEASLPLGRLGEVDEISPTALMLATRGGDNYVGQTLSPNGGDVLL